MPHINPIITPGQAADSGITVAQILACADWNDEMGAAAYNGGIYDEAVRLWVQASNLRDVATVVLLRKAA